MSRQNFAHRLRLRFGMSQTEPTDYQLNQIIAHIRTIRKNRTPTDADWRHAVETYCPTAGQYRYASQDFSDLNDLLDQLIGDEK